MDTRSTRFLTTTFFSLIGLAASLVLFLLLYWALRLNSSITSLVSNTAAEPLYFWPYVLLTLGTIVLFGVNVSLLVYRWRRFGPPQIKKQAGGGLGGLVGIVASACPVCGSALLAAVGIAGGLATFPLQGLELNALSFALMALSVWLTFRDLRIPICADGTCPSPREPSFQAKDRAWFIASLAVIAISTFVGWDMLRSDPAVADLAVPSSNPIVAAIRNSDHNRLNDATISPTSNQLFDEVAAAVLPEEGFHSKIVLSDSVVKLVEYGVIDKERFEAIYKERGGLPSELTSVLTEPSYQPILLTRENANVYVNLLWPLGLANYMSSNMDSPVYGESLFNFASTAGWNLGVERNGAAYFSQLRIVQLTPEQEALVTGIAQNTYRPCCNNSTFFQDCNHGSALLGLLELGASQGLTEEELYREAVAFNSFWFPHQYIQTALYFKAVKQMDWEQVDPRIVMSFDYSSISGWGRNVQAEIAKIPNLIPQTEGGQRCEL